MPSTPGVLKSERPGGLLHGQPGEADPTRRTADRLIPGKTLQMCEYLLTFAICAPECFLADGKQTQAINSHFPGQGPHVHSAVGATLSLLS